MVLLKQYDESGRLVSTFVISKDGLNVVKERDIRSGVAHKARYIYFCSLSTQHANRMQEDRGWSSMLQIASEVFLPAGYPTSVTDDYLPYECFSFACLHHRPGTHIATGTRPMYEVVQLLLDNLSRLSRMHCKP